MTQLREAERLASERTKRDQERQEANKRAMDRLDVPGHLTALFNNVDQGEYEYTFNAPLSPACVPVDSSLLTHYSLPSSCTGWMPPQSEKNVVKSTQVPLNASLVQKRISHLRLPADLEQHAFTKFTNIYFRTHVWAAKKDPIQTPFLPKSNEIHFHESLALFKLVSSHDSLCAQYHT